MKHDIDSTILQVKQQIIETIIASEKGIFGSPLDREAAQKQRKNAFDWVHYLARFCYLKGKQDAIRQKEGEA